MEKEKKEKVKKDHSNANKKMGLAAAILIIIPCLTLATFAILDVTGAFPLLGTPRMYTAEFYDEDELLDKLTIKRGDKLEYDYEPSAPGNTFVGWDLDNNRIPDPLPDRVYYSFVARALWRSTHEKTI